MGKKSKKRIGVVYSTEPDFEYTYENNGPDSDPAKSEQKLRVLLDRKKRRGKEVTLVTGWNGTEDTLKELGKLLKSKCGVGGSTKDNEIILQGDHRDKVVELLKKEGYGNTKKSGG